MILLNLRVYKGNTAAVLAHYARQSNRRVYLFDTFEGFEQTDIKGIDPIKNPHLFRDTSIDIVKYVIGDKVNACDFVKGHFPNSLEARHRETKYAIVSLDCDFYEPMKAGLDFFTPCSPEEAYFCYTTAQACAGLEQN